MAKKAASKGAKAATKADVINSISEKTKLGKGSLSYADGCLYCLSDSDGIVTLVAADPVQKWQETGRFTLPQKSDKRKPAARIWTHPVVANGRLYLRDQELIFCYEVRK